MNRLEQAKLLADSATRFARLIELNAPEILIEGARKSLFKRMFNFPVNSEAQESVQKLDAEMRQDEMDALNKAGYFDNVEPPLTTE